MNKKKIGLSQYKKIKQQTKSYKQKITNLSASWKGTKTYKKVKIAALVQKREKRLVNLVQAQKKLTKLRGYTEKQLRRYIHATGDTNSKFYSPKANQKFLKELYRRKITQQPTNELKDARKEALNNIKAKIRANKNYTQRDSYLANRTRHMNVIEYVEYTADLPDKSNETIAKEWYEAVSSDKVKPLAQGVQYGYIDEQEYIVISPQDL